MNRAALVYAVGGVVGLVEDGVVIVVLGHGDFDVVVFI